MNVRSFSKGALKGLDLDPQVRQALDEAISSIEDAYRDRFIELTDAISRQASTLQRIQETLHILVKHVVPTAAGTAPVAFRTASPDETPDLATVAVLDPIAAGYTLSQRDLADALGLDQPTVSILVRAFKLPEDPECALTIRRGRAKAVVNYRPFAAERFRALVKNPPSGLGKPAASAMKKARRLLT